MSLEELSQMTVNVSSPWLWISLYVLGMFTWGRKEAQNQIDKFREPIDTVDRVFFVIAAFVLRATSPSWFLFRILIFFFYASLYFGEKILGVNQRKAGWTNSVGPR